MSGIVGICHRDGAPVERPILEALTQSLSYRGPDACETWCAESIGFGHTMLRTSPESLGERQPRTIDGQRWIVADARIDCRAELVAALRDSGVNCEVSAPDPELILRSYAAWGEDCVAQLRGDYAFAIWDGPRKTLFCVRDHFGIKLFYYAQIGQLFLFSNTLNCLRAHPQVSDELNEAAIADFLLFGLNYDLSTTTFRDIQRLAPAHTLTLSPDGLRVRRYWSPPTDGLIRYQRDEEYVERFREILESAVADRIRADRVGILLSGGLDSGAVAVAAREISQKAGGVPALRAFTVTYETLFADREGFHARNVAEYLKIPIEMLPMDHLQLFGGPEKQELITPEPTESPLYAGTFEEFRAISAYCRVVLSGEGNDNLMDFQMWPYARHLMRQGEWGRLLSEGLRFFSVRQFPWRGIRQRLLHFFAADPVAPIFPRWLATDFARRARVQERWKECSRLYTDQTHQLHPRGHASLSLPLWSKMFEDGDANATRFPVEVRYPFLDLRMVDYLLALPAFPWFFQKRLTRLALAGRFPEQERQRPKTPLASDPVSEIVKRTRVSWLQDAPWDKEVHRFIDLSQVETPGSESTYEFKRVALRAHCLNFWLQSSLRVRYKLNAEACDG